MMKLEEIVSEAAMLPEEERAALASRLLDSSQFICHHVLTEIGPVDFQPQPQPQALGALAIGDDFGFG